VIFTIRSKSQGGMVQLTSAQERSIWQFVAGSGLADFIDIELYDARGNLDEDRITSMVDEIHGAGGHVILSHHDFNKMPAPGELISIVKAMTRLGADICKIAAMAYSKEEATNLLKATAFLTKNNIGPVALMAMGEWGKTTRVAGGKYGSCITFASGKGQSAPGQVDTHTMKKWLDDYYGEE
jgi:3-dehydroquinate dehydratase-1